MSFKRAWIGCGLVLVACSSAQAGLLNPDPPGNLIVDGTFSTPSINTWYQDYGAIPSGPYKGDSWSGFSFNSHWIILPNNVDVVNGADSPGGAPGYNGEKQYLDLVGYGSTGGISQIFATTPGKTYDLSFAYGNNPWSTSFASAVVTVLGLQGLHLVDLLSETISHSGSTDSNIDWSTITYTFTADSLFTALNFSTLVGSNDGGILLDAVSVTAAPLPASWGFMLTGLTGLGFVGFRWKSKAAAIGAV